MNPKRKPIVLAAIWQVFYEILLLHEKLESSYAHAIFYEILKKKLVKP